MNEKEILQSYEVISKFYEKYLKDYKVKVINLKDKNDISNAFK